MPAFTDSGVENAALAWLETLGYAVLHGPDIALGEPGAERSDPNYRDVLLERRLRTRSVKCARATVARRLSPGPRLGRRP